MCILNRLIFILMLSAALPCAAQCEYEALLIEDSGRVPLAKPCAPSLSVRITTSERWQLNLGLLNPYRTDAKLPLGIRVEKNDRFRQSIEVTPLLQIEKRF